MFNDWDAGAGSADPPHGFCRQFSLAEIQATTNNFDDTFSYWKRDVKSTNILLDENWLPKISDFVLSKIGITSHWQTQINTKGQILPHSLKLFGEITSKCIHSHPRGRPTMAKVVASLELTLASEQDSHQCKEMIAKLVRCIFHLVAKGIEVMGQSKWRAYCLKNELPLHLKNIGIKMFRHFSLSEFG
ncbi:unnamed protein product [Thlaspi arvense]|uniref:Uncharacterized protein n=1 Tax=Thlaspi arvense TaxID=13288 RepID=A0AAU9RL05_THLAR|nr:unnamed protein product [Thlaspi arvense]